ncbi:hypothetical protein CFE53_01040 [Methanofervidicoccus sp. A16]|uniref:class III signal peptide-containing protein n=1 Tax=Methanofervidicoccus sp. A16 TaxID=2607662 RepID=UPI00118CAAB7|nr:class III signal peptide-containing protein [Methanofervidicoccus sp. A16]AXI24822.1 hypothetical protein CFE53_01040 [Methanofervidicoccus sp. A16]
MIIEKLISKRGQISMELGILVAAAVAVAAIAAYYYVKSVSDSAGAAEDNATQTINELGRLAENATGRLRQITLQ